MSGARGWIGVDLDGTLARYDGWKGAQHIGSPVPAMLKRVRRWIAEGREVRVFTARCYPIAFVRADDDPMRMVGANEREDEAIMACVTIQAWCREHVGTPLAITCRKDYGMIELWDDRAVQVEPNTGRRVDGA